MLKMVNFALYDFYLKKKKIAVELSLTPQSPVWFRACQPTPHLPPHPPGAGCPPPLRDFCGEGAKQFSLFSSSCSGLPCLYEMEEEGGPRVVKVTLCFWPYLRELSLTSL